MAQFIQGDAIDKPPLVLVGCDIVPDLNELTYEDLPLTLKLQLKRSSVRALVIKRQSKNFLRYEMFKRLNTGGSALSEQEIRNCSARIFGDGGIRFYENLVELSRDPEFVYTTNTISDSDDEKRGREELVLRFFAAKNGSAFYYGNVAEWLSSYMEAVLLRHVPFDYENENAMFKRVFSAVRRVCGDGAFCKFKNDRPTGGLAPAYYEAVVCSFAAQIEAVDRIDSALLNEKLIQARQSEEFRGNVGTGANKKSKLIGRINVLAEAIKSVS